jgi:hypothetical protein
MAEVRTPKTVNVHQFCYENGAIPLRVRQRDGETVIASDAASEADLLAAVDAHTADPTWTHPNPPPPPPDPQAEFDQALDAAAAKPTVEEKVDAMLAALRGTGLPGKAAARGK